MKTSGDMSWPRLVGRIGGRPRLVGGSDREQTVCKPRDRVWPTARGDGSRWYVGGHSANLECPPHRKERVIRPVLPGAVGLPERARRQMPVHGADRFLFTRTGRRGMVTSQSGPRRDVAFGSIRYLGNLSPGQPPEVCSELAAFMLCRGQLPMVCFELAAFMDVLARFHTLHRRTAA